MTGAILDVPGIRVGHCTDREHATGCTVVLAPPEGAVAGVDVRGPAPGTRETDLLRGARLVERVHAVLLTGGSAFGLDAASGVMRWLEEQGIGFDAGVARVPIVPAAVLFDLGIGNPAVRPGAAEGYAACASAVSEGLAEGSVGAGTGATVGKLLGMARATKGGLGMASRTIKLGEQHIHIGALIAVNTFGDIVDLEAGGAIVAGTRKPDGTGWLDTEAELYKWCEFEKIPALNTAIGVVVTDAALTREEANLMATTAQDGIARTVRPAHSMWDGDTLFVLATGTSGVGTSTVPDRALALSLIGQVAAQLVAEAMVRGVRTATGLAGVKAWNE